MLSPSSALGGPVTVQTVQQGRLLVAVTLDNGSGFKEPLPGVHVLLTQPVFRGLRLSATTNGTGEWASYLASGDYAVSVGDQRFDYATSVPVTAGTETRIQVGVNMTSFTVVLAEAEDTTGTGSLGPWDQLVAAIQPAGLRVFISPPGDRNATVYYTQAAMRNYSGYRFPSTVFIEPMRFTRSDFGIQQGIGVAATVVSQEANGGLIWLTLRPAGLLDVSGANYLEVFSYEAGGAVSFVGE